MPLKRITLEITEILGDGNCPQGHKVGDIFNYPEDCGKICSSALHSIYPTIQVIASGGSFPWFDQEKLNEWSRCCPDPKRPVVFKITGMESEE
ncbi:MAG: TIGR04076 family protein [Candidatus Odinarchaeota archaeon]